MKNFETGELKYNAWNSNSYPCLHVFNNKKIKIKSLLMKVFALAKKSGSSPVKSVSVLPNIYWCGYYCIIQHSIYKTFLYLKINNPRNI